MIDALSESRQAGAQDDLKRYFPNVSVPDGLYPFGSGRLVATDLIAMLHS